MRAPNDGNTHGPSWRAGYDAGRARHDALLAALRRLADACEDMTLTHAARCTAIGRYARAAITKAGQS